MAMVSNLMQGANCEDTSTLGAFDCGKKSRDQVDSLASSVASLGSVGRSDTTKSGDSTIESEALPLSDEHRCPSKSVDDTLELEAAEDLSFSDDYRCPHCNVKFETREALDQHDTCMTMPVVVDSAFKSGNGTIAAVGVNFDGKIQCPHCCQKYDSERALELHCKFIHDGAVFNNGYTLEYSFDNFEQINA